MSLVFFEKFVFQTEFRTNLCLFTDIRMWVLPFGVDGEWKRLHRGLFAVDDHQGHLLTALILFQDCCLIVYHPYRPLLQYVQDMGQEDMLLPLAWYCTVLCLWKACLIRSFEVFSLSVTSVFLRRIVNDTYRTDLCLLYPPFMIALGKSGSPSFSHRVIKQLMTEQAFFKSELIICSFYPPACLHVACVVQQKDARQWFAELSVDMDKVRLISCSEF